LLETLAELPFPVNPEIQQQTASVEFPCYDSWLDGVRHQLAAAGFRPGALEVRPLRFG